MSDREVWVSDDGMVLQGVHPATECEGRGCAIHHPSDHHMKDWPLKWRGDRDLMERICPCGIGHPDVDHLAWFRLTHSEDDTWAEGVHGCCGHCRAEAAA